MKSWEHEVGDVLLIRRKGEEMIARVDGYVDQLDNTKPLYVNLRAEGNAWWRKTRIKVEASQIIKPLPTWEEDHKAEVMVQYEKDIKKLADGVWAGMTARQKEQWHKQVALYDNRSPLDILIDQAVTPIE